MKKVLLLVLLALAFPAASSAHLGISKAKATRMMRGAIASECPGYNHDICLKRRDAVLHHSDAHCWDYNTNYTHKEAFWPFSWGARWYGSLGKICHGRWRYHWEYDAKGWG